MGNIINFMEKLGASAEFQELSEAEVLEMLQQQNFAENQEREFHAKVETLLDVRKNLVCGVLPAEEPADEPEQDPSDEPQENQEKTE